MSWFFLALVTPALTSVGNFIDKLLTERFVSKEATVGVLSLYSALFSLTVLPVLFFASHDVLAIEMRNAGLLILAGVIEIISVFLYLNALRDEDTSTVVPLFQSIPVFSLVFGYLLLNETLSGLQTLAGSIIVLGGVILTLEFSEERKVRIRSKTLVLMLGASACFALYDALFKLSALSENFWTALFWQHVGIALLGVIVFAGKVSYRRDFMLSVQSNGQAVFGLNVLNELLYAIGVGFYSYALLLAPIALVATVTTYQPVFVFGLGTLLTLIFPHLIHERITPRHLLQKCFAIGIMVMASGYLAITY